MDNLSELRNVERAGKMLFPIVSGKQNLAFALIGSEKRLFFFKQNKERKISFSLFELECPPSWESEKDVNREEKKSQNSGKFLNLKVEEGSY